MRKLSVNAIRLLTDIANGQARVFCMHGLPFGWREVERRGYARRIEGTDRAEITESGLQAIGRGNGSDT